MNQCEILQAVGVTRNGAFGEYVVVPEGAVFPIGDIPYDAAAMIEPLACVVWGIKRIGVQPGDSALIFGAGPMGCLVAQGLRSSGASEVTIVDLVSWRLEIAKNLGFNTVLKTNRDPSMPLSSPEGYQIVVEATGLKTVLQAAFNYVKPRGKIWVFGVVPRDEIASFSPYEVFRKDLSIIGSFAVNQTFYEAIQMIQSGAVDVLPLISHRVCIQNFVTALEIAQSGSDRMKIQLTFP
jgi:threonine dehydrogenase-like Zn-dependent dehydrogenase